MNRNYRVLMSVCVSVRLCTHNSKNDRSINLKLVTDFSMEMARAMICIESFNSTHKHKQNQQCHARVIL